MDKKTNLDIKELVKNGYSAEDITKMVNDQIVEAKEEISKEETSKENISKLRQNVIDAATAYLEAVTGEKVEIDKDEVSRLSSFFDTFERRASTYKPFHAFDEELHKNGHAKTHFRNWDGSEMTLDGILKQW